MLLHKVISGGQTGADRGGLKAAKRFGLATGGTMCLGFRALDGNHPEFAQLYGMQEIDSSNYAVRTLWNVADADATIRFATDWSSPGELATFRSIKNCKKPYYDVDLRTFGGGGNVLEAKDSFLWSIELICRWLEAQEVRILNVAGNSEQTSPGIEGFTEDILVHVFTQLRKM